MRLRPSALISWRLTSVPVSSYSGTIHIPGAERHAAGFMRRGERQTFQTGKALAGEVGVAGGRSDFLQQSDGQRGRCFAVGLPFRRLRPPSPPGPRRQMAGHGVHLPGGLGCRQTLFLPVSGRHRRHTDYRTTSCALFIVKRKRSEPPHTGQA